jgi:hypothetical protein
MGQAQSLVSAGMAPYERVVVNPAQRWALKFEVISEVSGPGCEPERSVEERKHVDDTQPINGTGGCTRRNVAYPVALSASESNLVDRLSDFYAETDGTLKTNIEVDGSDLRIPDCAPEMCVRSGGSAFDVVRNAIYRASVLAATERYLNETSTTFARLMAAFGIAGEITFLGGDFSISILVHFGDGSKIVIIFDNKAHELGEVVQARDPNNMDVIMPANAREFVGSWEYPHWQNAVDFLNHAERAGIPIYGPGGGGYGPGITCIFEANSQQTMCRRTPGGGG